jgi:hypothetical protein
MFVAQLADATAPSEAAWVGFTGLSARMKMCQPVLVSDPIVCSSRNR